jgi:Xaa-Pro aminopeptidase
MENEVVDITLAPMYTARRDKLMERMGQGIALVGSPAVSPDALLFDKNLRYLTGQESKKSFLLLAPNGVCVQRYETNSGPEVGRGRIVREILFTEERTAWEKLLDGEVTGEDIIRQESGVEVILPVSRLHETLQDNLINEETLWFNVATCPSLDEPLSPDLVLLNRIKERFLWLQVQNIAPLIHEMRRVKEPYEIGCLRRAYQIHTEILEKIMRTLKPGDNESLAEAIWHYDARVHYSPKDVSSEALDLYAAHIIVAAGSHTAIAHYADNNAIVQDGDLVLIDTGIEYKGYSSDITRTFPANGTFTPRQRELYEIALKAQKRAIATMKPGCTARQAHEAVYQVWVEHDLQQYGFGLCGHPVGLNIHDANSAAVWDQDQPFEPGVVVAIEPFIAIPEEGIGIRIEDGVLITEDGCEIMPGPPKEIADIEALCRRK